MSLPPDIIPLVGPSCCGCPDPGEFDTERSATAWSSWYVTAVRQLVSAPGLAASLDLSAWAPKAPSRLSLDHTWRRSMMLVSHSVSQRLSCVWRLTEGDPAGSEEARSGPEGVRTIHPRPFLGHVESKAIAKLRAASIRLSIRAIRAINQESGGDTQDTEGGVQRVRVAWRQHLPEPTRVRRRRRLRDLSRLRFYQFHVYSQFHVNFQRMLQQSVSLSMECPPPSTIPAVSKSEGFVNALTAPDMTVDATTSPTARPAPRTSP